MKTISMVITNSGDGSNAVHWVTDPAVLDKMQELAMTMSTLRLKNIN